LPLLAGLFNVFQLFKSKNTYTLIIILFCLRSISDGEASGMVGEAPGPVNFTQMVMLFAEKMAGGMKSFMLPKIMKF
jgi:hypothetical protein